jgi:hypothetical protein
VALVHYPVLNKNNDIIASAVTNLDLHDIARAAKTYGVKSFYVVTPLKDQSALVAKIIAHWTNGPGAIYNPKRRQALELIRVRETLEAVIEDIRNNSDHNQKPRTVVTSARHNHINLSFSGFCELLKNGDPYLLVLGTAWGLSEGIIVGAEYVLDSVKGNTNYNHLSVRSAAAIIFDRLLGQTDYKLSQKCI